MADRQAKRPALRLVDDEVPRGPWIYARNVAPPEGEVAAGELVEVLDRSERFLGHAFYNPWSDLRLRWLSRGRRTALDRPREFLLAVLRSADRLRRRTLRLERETDAYRVAHAEGDDLPGLVVDRLGDWLVAEFHALGTWRVREDVRWALGELYPGMAERIVLRVPRSARRAEGFEREGAPSAPPFELGAPSPSPGPGPGETTIRENGLVFPVVPGGGHKTGWFCDQRDNRRRVAALAEGRHVLDLCCNAGGFALQAARAGAKTVVGVDLDEVVLERAREAARRNGLEARFEHADAFAFLRELEASGHRPEVCVLDPHKLIKGRADREKGTRAYADLNHLVLRVVRPGGLLATFSCSGALDLPGFLGIVFASARRAERPVRLLEVLGAAPDHPQRGGWPGSRYLKGALLAVD